MASTLNCMPTFSRVHAAFQSRRDLFTQDKIAIFPVSIESPSAYACPQSLQFLNIFRVLQQDWWKLLSHNRLIPWSDQQMHSFIRQ